MHIAINNYTINLATGKGDWTVIPDINEKRNRQLNIIGYEGELNGKRMTFQEYFNTEFRNKTQFKVELLKSNNMEFTATYLITRVKL